MAKKGGCKGGSKGGGLGNDIGTAISSPAGDLVFSGLNQNLLAF